MQAEREYKNAFWCKSGAFVQLSKNALRMKTKNAAALIPAGRVRPVHQMLERLDEIGVPHRDCGTDSQVYDRLMEQHRECRSTNNTEKLEYLSESAALSMPDEELLALCDSALLEKPSHLALFRKGWCLAIKQLACIGHRQVIAIDTVKMEEGIACLSASQDLKCASGMLRCAAAEDNIASGYWFLSRFELAREHWERAVMLAPAGAMLSTKCTYCAKLAQEMSSRTESQLCGVTITALAGMLSDAAVMVLNQVQNAREQQKVQALRVNEELRIDPLDLADFDIIKWCSKMLARMPAAQYAPANHNQDTSACIESKALDIISQCTALLESHACVHGHSETSVFLSYTRGSMRSLLAMSSCDKHEQHAGTLHDMHKVVTVIEAGRIALTTDEHFNPHMMWHAFIACASSVVWLLQKNPDGTLPIQCWKAPEELPLYFLEQA